MKKYTILLATIILAFAACNKETPAPEMPDAPDAPHGTVPFTFHATVGELTRTEISENADGSAAVLWKATDKVSVFDAAGNNCEFSVSGAGSTATLSGELVPSSSGKYYAVYPYASSSTLSGTTVTAEIPSVQKVSGPGFADGAVVSAAVVSEEAATFCNLASLVRFTVPEDVTTLRSVTLASTAPLSGALVMDFAGGSPAVTSVPDHATTVTVEMEDGSALPSGNYYAAVLPGTHKLTVTLTDKDGMTAERSMDESKEFLSSHIRGIGSVKADTFDNVEFVLGDAAVSGETKTLIMSAKIPAGTYTVEQLLGVTSYPYKGDKAIYVIRNVSFTVESTTERQTVTIPKAALTARHLLVREGDDLQAVLNAAEAGLDDVYVGAGTFTGGFTMVEGINVTGSWDADFTETTTFEPVKNFTTGKAVSTSAPTTVLDGGNSRRVLYQSAAFETVTIWKNLKIQNGRSTDSDDPGLGAGACLNKNGVLDGCEICNNEHTTGQGAGMMGWEFSTAIRCYFHNNKSKSHGGAFLSRGYVEYCVCENNESGGDGAGGYLYGVSGLSRPHIFNSVIRNNTAGGNGGGIRMNAGVSDYEPIAFNLLVYENTTGGSGMGSGINSNLGCVYNCTIVKNHASGTNIGANACGLNFQSGNATNTKTAYAYNNLVCGNTTSADGGWQMYVNPALSNNNMRFRNNTTTADGVQYSNKPSQYYTITTNLDPAVAFVNYEENDFHLSASTDSNIKAGLWDNGNFLPAHRELLPTVDLDGNPRLTDNAIHQGCYQYQ